MVRRDKVLEERASIAHCLYCLSIVCTPDFVVLFNATSLHVKNFLHWVCASTVAPMRAVVAVLTEMSQRRTSEHLTIGFAVNEDRVLAELGTEQMQKVQRASPSLFMYSKRDQQILHLSFRLVRDGDVSDRALHGTSSLQADLKTVAGPYGSKGPWPGLAMSPLLGSGHYLAPFVLFYKPFDRQKGYQCP